MRRTAGARRRRRGASGYEAVRGVLAPEYAELPNTNVEHLVEDLFAGQLTAGDLEDFLGTLKKIGRAAAPVVSRALPGAIQGATTGAALGPWGALGGALVGGTTGALGGGGRPRAHAPRAAAPPPAMAPGAGIPAPAVAPVAAAAPMTTPAAAQLLMVLFRPEVLQALASMMLGSAGRRAIPVSGSSVPVAAVGTMVGELASLAGAEYHAAISDADDVPAYLRDATGALRVDPTVPEERTARLLELLDQAASAAGSGEDDYLYK